MRKIYYDKFYEVPTEERVFFVHRKIWVNPDHTIEDQDWNGEVFTKEFFSNEDCHFTIGAQLPDEINFSNFGLSFRVTGCGIREIRPSQFFLLVKDRLGELEEIGTELKQFFNSKRLDNMSSLGLNNNEAHEDNEPLLASGKYM